MFTEFETFPAIPVPQGEPELKIVSGAGIEREKMGNRWQIKIK